MHRKIPRLMHIFFLVMVPKIKGINNLIHVVYERYTKKKKIPHLHFTRRSFFAVLSFSSASISSPFHIPLHFTFSFLSFLYPSYSFLPFSIFLFIASSLFLSFFYSYFIFCPVFFFSLKSLFLFLLLFILPFFLLLRLFYFYSPFLFHSLSLSSLSACEMFLMSIWL